MRKTPGSMACTFSPLTSMFSIIEGVRTTNDIVVVLLWFVKQDLRNRPALN